MIEWLLNIDKKAFLFLNGLHADWLDPIMKVITSHGFWIPLIILFVALSIKYYRKNFWVPVVFTIICFCLTDVGSNMTKKSVKRDRPTHNIELKEKVHTVVNPGGRYGFFSGHAANGFGLALITLLFVRKKYYTYIVLAWAILVSYSRIYVGVHFPLDIIVGASFGIIAALLTYKLFKSMPFYYKRLE